MQWAAVHGPRLVLDHLLQGLGPDIEDQRIASCDGRHILQCTRGAMAVGVHPGQGRASALTLAHDLRLIEPPAQQAQQALHDIGQWLLQFSPRVTVYGPQTLVLEVGRSLRLFGGPTRLMHRIRQGLQQQGFQIRTALAPTARAACLLARWQDEACIAHESSLAQDLATLPLSLLDSAAPHLEGLAQIGAQHLGDLLQLPRQGLGQRYGPALLDELDAALGHRLEALGSLMPMARFDARIDLLHGVEQAGALLHAGQILIERLCGWLQARGLATREAVLHAMHEGRQGLEQAPTRIPIRLTQASRDPSRMCLVLRERLPITRLSAPAHAVSIQCLQTVAQASTVSALFPELHPDAPVDGLSRLLERLQSRLGPEHVLRVEPLPDHRPERASQSVPWSLPARSPAPRQAGQALPQGSILPRPLWLLSPPLALEEQHHRPYWNGPLALLTGPERIETGWWDDHLVERDYFIAQTEQAAWVWIFRTRPTQGDSGWFLQGVFG